MEWWNPIRVSSIENERRYIGDSQYKLLSLGVSPKGMTAGVSGQGTGGEEVKGLRGQSIRSIIHANVE